jgi:hypothetical protein
MGCTNSMEKSSRFTDPIVRKIINKIPESELEDIGVRVERVNPNIKNILVTGGAGFM